MRQRQVTTAHWQCQRDAPEMCDATERRKPRRRGHIDRRATHLGCFRDDTKKQRAWGGREGRFAGSLFGGPKRKVERAGGGRQPGRRNSETLFDAGERKPPKRAHAHCAISAHKYARYSLARGTTQLCIRLLPTLLQIKRREERRIGKSKGPGETDDDAGPLS